MLKLKEMLKSSHVQISFAVGFSIIAFACFSKWVFPEPIHPMLLTIPPLIEALYEGLLKKYKDAEFLKTWYWICAILFSTVLIIILHIL
jgi:4-amino-4-deoxy-L-arabinose transferase-like glycosyltransferase